MTQFNKINEWFPLSSAQRSRWFSYQLDDHNRGSHNNGFAIRLHGVIEVKKIVNALNKLAARHAMLRVSFRSHNGEPEQRVTAVVEVPLFTSSMNSWAESELQQQVLNDCNLAFDLTQAPMVRAHLYPTNSEEAVLLFVFDHLTCDGWSYWQMLDELGQLLSESEEDSAPTDTVVEEYRDYISWQRTWVESSTGQSQWNYWQKILGQDLPILDLPTDRPITKESGQQTAIVSTCLSTELTSQLHVLAKKESTSLLVILMAAYQIVLHRHTGQDEIVVGTPMPARSRAQWDHVVGDFVNPIAIRTLFKDEPNVKQLLSRVRSSVMRGMQNQDYPFGLLVEKLQPTRNQALSPIFQTMFTMQKARQAQDLLVLWKGVAEAQKMQWGGFAVSSFPIHQSGGARDFGLALEVIELDEIVRCDFGYDPTLFDGTSIERFATHFQNALRGMLTDQSIPVATLAMHDPCERDQLQNQFNDSERAYPQNKLVPQLFEAQAEAQPEAIALEHETQSMTYGELNTRANQVAHALLSLGVKPDDLVAICIERSVDMIVGMLGILKAGAAYVPLDPSHPDQRLAYMLDDCTPAALLVGSGLEQRLGSITVPVLHLTGTATTLVQQPTHNPDPVVLGLKQDHLAYVIYTSGSTGLPKGVMLEHRNVVNLIWNQVDTYAMSAHDRVLQFASFGFDNSVSEIFPALAVGAAVVLRPAHIMVPDQEFITFLQEKKITIADLPTAFWHEWALEIRSKRGMPGPYLRLIAAGGEKAECRHLATWFAEPALKACRWVNTYGPTEATVNATSISYDATSKLPAHEIPIGRPIANTQVYILDQHLQIVPTGVAGEIHIGGSGIARGYLNRPELTAERFIVNHFSSDSAARLYKTGDLGRWLADGTLEYLGRNDFQVKIRGYRIELGEIEAKLTQCEGVREAIVIAREDGVRVGEANDVRLVAYLLTQTGLAPSVQTLRDDLLKVLPDYMVPSAFVTLDAFPLTTNGKLDRKALPAPDQTSVLTYQYEAPQGEIEMALAQIWQKLLGLERVGRHDNFFELGGHSLLAVQVISRLRQVLGVEVALRELFAAPTLAGFASAVDNSRQTVLSAILPADRSQVIPLSWAQQRLWFLDQLDHAAGVAYHMAAGYRLTGVLNEAALQATFDCIVSRHESLRTSFVMQGNEALQKIGAPDVGFRLQRQDLSALSGHELESAIERIGADEASAPFDLATGPLIRGRLLYVAEQEHILLITQHHIISDGWSIGVLIREVCTLYTAFSQGQANPLPALAIQYPDYAAWQRGWLAGELLEEQINFWKAHLEGAPALITLPTDRPRPAVQSYTGGSARVELPVELSTQLRALSQRHGTTLFMTLLAGWSVLLARMSGQDEIVVGCPIANRQRSETEHLIGFFVNTLALRVKLEANPSVSELLAQVKGTTLEGYAHQDLPFEQVVEAIKPTRNTSHSPLFQVVLSLDNTPDVSQDLNLPGLTLSGIAQTHTTTQFELMLSLSDNGIRIAGDLTYSDSLFDASSIRRLLGHFETLLESMVANPEQSVSQLALLTSQQRQYLLETVNATTAVYPHDQLIDQLFEEQVRERPDAIALVYGEQRVTYAELNRRANQLAHTLLDMGVKADDRVALCAERSIELVVGMLGILKAGGAYVPLDPSYPAERLVKMLSDCAPVALLTQAALEDDLPALSLMRVVVLDGFQDSEQIARQPTHNPTHNQRHANNLAYVIYTSGTSGTPKGVMIEHRNVLRLVKNSGFAPLGVDDCVAHCASPAFDAATWEIWGALLNGAKLIVIAQDILLNPLILNINLIETKVTALFLTTGLFNAYLDAISPALGKLRYLLTGGEVIDTRSVVKLLSKVQRPLHLLHVYGPTETTTYATSFEIKEVSEGDRTLPIGKPIANTQIYLLDTHMEPVPLGVTGELYIGGDGVGRGYLNQAELSAQRFIADPFSKKSSARLYRSGDLARRLADGTIDYQDRNDYQVKIRGYRIELGEIETKLRACDEVRDAIVLVRQESDGDKRLVAYVVPEEGSVLEADSLRRQLSQSLAAYMIPAAFVSLKVFPLTLNGKIDRIALPALGQTALVSAAYVAPQGATESLLAGIWQELLGLPQVGRDDDFFNLGGHSLLAVQVISRLRQALGVEVALRELFAAPTLAGFANAVDNSRQSILSAILPADRSQPLPLSWAQQRLWFLDQLDHAAGAAYHMAAGYQLTGVLNEAALQATFDCIVARHESLRTSFVMQDNEAIQKIGAPDIGFQLQRQDLSALSGHELESAIERIGTDEASAPFDLATGPLIRGRLLYVSEQEHILLIIQHHIISDGWSIGVLIREVCTLYTAFSQGQANPLPALAIQYPDYAAWQRGWLTGELLQEQVSFWKGHLEGAPALITLPTDRPRPAVQSYTGSIVKVELSVELSAQLRDLSQRHGTTMFMTFLAGWSILLSRMSGQNDIVVGCPIANRQRSETETLIGFFVNTLALRVKLEDDPTVASVLAQVKATTLGSYAHQDLPFEQVVEAINPVRSMGHSPIFQTMLALNNTPSSGPLALPGLTLSDIGQVDSTTQFDLSLSLTEIDDIVFSSIDYATDLFDQSSIARLHGSFQILLAAMAADDAQRVSELHLLTTADAHLMLNEWNRSGEDFPLEQTYATLFAKQVALHPERMAVVCGEESISYRELDERAARLAQVLLNVGVESEQLVTLICERNITLLVMMLAVFKAGAAFLPLDINHPIERLREIATLSQSTLILESTSCGHVVDAMVDSLANNPMRIVAEQHWLAGPVPVVVPRGTPDDLAYVIFTSGSTGKPKGAMVEQRGMVNNMYGKLLTMQVGLDDRLAQTASPAFDICVWQFLSAALVGATCDILPDVVAFDPPRLIEAVASRGITLLQTVPSMMRGLLEVCNDATDLGCLRWLLPTGEALPLNVAQEWFEQFPAIPLMNVYGPAECSDDVTYHVLLQRPEDGSVIPIGRPTPNNQIYIVDHQLRPVPIGVVGEICIGGVGVGRGYLNNSEQTSKAFVQNPFCEGERFYRTGDLGRYRVDGVIEFVGRRDFQVKIRGFRIELGEIEAKLNTCDGVRDAIVMAREGHAGDKRLVAYIVAQEGVIPEAVQLRVQLLTMLADYMVPSAFVVLEAFPLTPNGKIDRKALPAPDQSALPTRQYEAPQGEVETTLAQIWQALLGLDRVGRHDNFFELGGHSLMATQLAVKVRNALAVELAIMKIFQAPTLSALSKEISVMKIAQFETSDIECILTEMDSMSATDLQAWLDQNQD